MCEDGVMHLAMYCRDTWGAELIYLATVVEHQRETQVDR